AGRERRSRRHVAGAFAGGAVSAGDLGEESRARHPRRRQAALKRPGLTRPFTLLCSVGLFAFISYNLVRMPVLSLFAQSLGASPEAIGFIVATSTLTAVLPTWPAEAAPDLYDRRCLF